jgi:hypothetical protein
MREISLTQCHVALVDDEDFEALSKFKWHAKRKGNAWYAARSVRLPDGRKVFVYMHRQILGVGPDEKVDHENRNSLDDRRENLRVATKSQNGQNRGKGSGTSSRFKGVFWHKARRRWQAHIYSGPIGQNGKARSVFLGLHDDEEAAAHAYDGAALASFGSFAHLNFPEVPA